VWNTTYVQDYIDQNRFFSDSVAGADHVRVAALWPVPEPVTALLLAGGLAAVAGIRRRRV
jgi:hypothetical protein